MQGTYSMKPIDSAEKRYFLIFAVIDDQTPRHCDIHSHYKNANLSDGTFRIRDCLKIKLWV
jgi:hypothetical protein